MSVATNEKTVTFNILSKCDNRYNSMKNKLTTKAFQEW